MLVNYQEKYSKPFTTVQADMKAAGGANASPFNRRHLFEMEVRIIQI